MSALWFYASEGQRKGPVPLDHLKDALQKGEINRQALVWREGLAEWQPLETVTELASLLQQIPPALPPAPPPLHPQGSTPTRRKGGSARQLFLVAFFGVLWEWLLNHWIVALTLLACIAGAILCFTLGICSDPEPERDPVVLGRLVIDANPWGTIEAIRRTDGVEMSLPSGATTPYILTVPAGEYEVAVTYPHGPTRAVCAVQVDAEAGGVCWLDLAPVTADTYFKTLGW